MDTLNTFEILLRRRIPILSSMLMGLMLLFSVCVLTLVLAMTLTNKSSDEMSTVYYMLVVPDLIKNISAIGAVGLMVTIPLYYRARLNKPATLVFNYDSIAVKANKVDLTISNKQIEKIFINELHGFGRRLKYALQIIIQQKDGKKTAFRLKNYADGDDFISTASVMENVQFSFYDDNMPTEHDDE